MQKTNEESFIPKLVMCRQGAVKKLAGIAALENKPLNNLDNFELEPDSEQTSLASSKPE